MSLATMKRLPILGLILAGLLGLARPACAEPSLWIVHGPGGATVTLFGSVHILPQGLDWEPPMLAKALQGAGELWFEIPIDPQTQTDAAQAALARGLLPPNQTLSGLLSKDGAQRLAAEAADYQLPLAKLERMQPWFAELIVSSAVFLRAGGRQDEGVEQKLASAAPQADRKAFETAAQQIGMFAGAPLADQVASLESTLRETTDDPTEYRDLVDAWLKGQDSQIYRHDVLTLKHDAPNLFRILITDRNAAWTRVLADRLQRPGQVVVVVGAGHLLGPDGVPARLRALGFKVDGPAE